MKMAFYWYLLLYSGLGYALELGYAWFRHGSLRERRTLLLLPMCPVYGLGAVGILALPPVIRQAPPLLAVCGGVTAAAAEYLMGGFYERVCRVSFWDYHDRFCQLKGRICLRFTVYWGLLSLILVYVVHPSVMRLVQRLPDRVCFPLVALFLADMAYTAFLLRSHGDKSLLDLRTLSQLEWS